MYSSRGLYIPYMNICVHLCVFKSMFASERVHMGVQLHASRLWVAMVLGFGTQREGIPSDLDRDRGGSHWWLQTAANPGRWGTDNLQFKWAATEGDSVSGGNGTARISLSNWWRWRPVQSSEPGGIVFSQVLFRLLHCSFLSGCLRLLSQKTGLSFETVLYVAPWCQQHH